MKVKDSRDDLSQCGVTRDQTRNTKDSVQVCSVLHVAHVGVRRVTVVIVHIGLEGVLVVIYFCVAILFVIFCIRRCSLYSASLPMKGPRPSDRGQVRHVTAQELSAHCVKASCPSCPVPMRETQLLEGTLGFGNFSRCVSDFGIEQLAHAAPHRDIVISGRTRQLALVPVQQDKRSQADWKSTTDEIRSKRILWESVGERRCASTNSVWLQKAT